MVQAELIAENDVEEKEEMLKNSKTLLHCKHYYVKWYTTVSGMATDRLSL